jgi:hypothetical protein
MTNKAPDTNIATISELLNISGSQYRLYDIGRLVSKLPKALFEKIELNQVPYPTPLQGNACIAIAFWQKGALQPYLWLLKLPLDERGLLNQGSRDHLIAIIIDALGADLTQEASKAQEELLNSNPYLFTPAQYKLASLNSKIKVDLKQKPSKHFLPFKSYLSRESNWNNWQGIGVQGITDFIARINEDNNSELLLQALHHLPSEVLSPVCSALENEQYPVTLIDAMITLLTNKITEQDNVNASQFLRALAANSQHIHVKEVIAQLMSQEHINAELLITLSGRCWNALTEEKVLVAYFEHLLHTNDLVMFFSIFKDLVAMPSIRPIAFQCIRSEHRSPALAHAIGQLFNQT